MARSYANTSTSIWRPGSTFTSLTPNAQWVYFMLSTQPDISAAGALSLNVKRWMGRARQCTREQIVNGIVELEVAGIVAYDTDTEELLVCPFVDDDQGYNNRKRRPVIQRAAGEIESAKLRKALAEEFARLGLPVEWLGFPTAEQCSRTDADDGRRQAHVGGAARRDNAAPSLPQDSTFPQVDSLSDSLSHRASDGLSDGPSLFDGVAVLPQPATHNPQPAPPTAGADQPPTAKKPRRATTRTKPDPATTESAQTVVAAYVDGAKERQRIVTPDLVKQVGAAAKRILTSGSVPHAKLVDAAREMGRNGWKDLNMQLLRGGDPHLNASGEHRNGQFNRHQPYLDPEDLSLYDRPL